MSDRPPPTTAPLVGREREQAMLREALAAARSGRGSLVLIGGEAGIGKTALAEDLCREAADAGALVLVGRCYDLSETPPYGPWVEALDRAPRDDELPPLPAAVLLSEFAGEAAISQDAIARRVRDYLAALAARRPLVLLLEDLHWADPASLDLLRVVARGLAEQRQLLLATYRDDAPADAFPLAALLPALVREARPTRLVLPRLGAPEARALVQARYPLPATDVARLVDHLQAHAEGNPLFLGELLRALEEAGILRPAGTADGWALGDLAGARVPPLLRQVIGARLGRLGAEAGRLLALAAVIGQAVPLDLWATASGADDEALAEVVGPAVAARVLLEAPEGAAVRFAHALVREALYEDIPLPRRRVLHRRVADALLATPAPDPDAMAYHLARAGDPRAFEWLARAGVRACNTAASLTAAARFAAAAALPDGDGARVRVRGWLHFCCARMLMYSDNARSLRALDEAEALALMAGDRVLATYARFARGQMRCLGGAIRLGLAEMQRQVADLDALPGAYHLRSGLDVGLALLAGGGRPSPPSRAPVGPTIALERANLANWHAHTGRYGEALALGEAFLAALAAGPGGDQPGPAAAVQVGLAHAHAALGRPDAAQGAFARGRAGYHARHEAHMFGFLLWSELLLVALPYRADRVAERARLAAEAVPAMDRAMAPPPTTPRATPADLPLALIEGRWTEALTVARAMLDAAVAGYVHGGVVALGVLARLQGDPETAWAWVRELLPAGPETEPGDAYFHHAIALQALAAALALDAGDLTLAGRWVAAHGRWLAWSGAALWQAEHQCLRARLAAAGGDLAAARAHAEAALARAAAPRQPLALLAGHRLLGELETAAGRPAESRAHLDTALALADACAAPYERALTLLALAELRAAAGLADEAGALLAEMRAICTPLEARPALARADALVLRLAGAGQAPPVPRSPDRLTAREVEVLRLIVAGRSNREMAAALCRSERTIERHLENIYRKIAARNRADATVFALRHGLA